VAFVFGLIGASIALFASHPAAFAPGAPTPPWVLAIAGLLVGIGTRVGSGCTSGHGVCGIGRFSIRSLIATVVFIIAGILAVALVRQLMPGGAP
jgi:uncharacterized membrane protein YedE/YeeE